MKVRKWHTFSTFIIDLNHLKRSWDFCLKSFVRNFKLPTNLTYDDYFNNLFFQKQNQFQLIHAVAAIFLQQTDKAIMRVV